MKLKHFAAAALSSALVLNAASAADSVFDGFYVGAKITGESSKYKKAELDGLGSMGFGGGLFGGYRAVMDSFVLGGELSARFVSDKATASKTPDAYVKRSWVGGAHLLVGTLLTPNFLAAVKLGVEYAPYKAKEIFDAANPTKEISKKKAAFNVGLVFEAPVADNLSLRLEGAVTPNVSLPDQKKAMHQTYGVGIVFKVN